MLASERAQGRPGFAQADHVAGNQPTSTTREPQGWLAPSLAVIAPVVMFRPTTGYSARNQLEFRQHNTKTGGTPIWRLLSGRN